MIKSWKQFGGGGIDSGLSGKLGEGAGKDVFRLLPQGSVQLSHPLLPHGIAFITGEAETGFDVHTLSQGRMACESIKGT